MAGRNNPDHWYKRIVEGKSPERIRQEKLLPAINLRPVIPRVCATCAYGAIEGGSFACIRPGGYANDVGDMRHWTHTCDRWKQGSITP
jgi:hypothetical protein